MSARHLLRSFRRLPLRQLNFSAGLHASYLTNCDSPIQSATRFRSYTTRSASNAYLIELLKSEIAQSKYQDGPKEVEVTTVGVGPFQLTDKPGMEDVILSRTFGNENIEIICMLEKQYPEESDEEEEQRLQHNHYHHYNKPKKGVLDEDAANEVVEVLHLSVNMKKGDVRLELDCSFVTGASEVMIESVLLHEADQSLSTGEPVPYGGPIFQDLDEDLQMAFHELLKVRGLTAKVARYMMQYMSNKENQEYGRWLHRLKAFLAH